MSLTTLQNISLHLVIFCWLDSWCIKQSINKASNIKDNYKTFFQKEQSRNKVFINFCYINVILTTAPMLWKKFQSELHSISVSLKSNLLLRLQPCISMKHLKYFWQHNKHIKLNLSAIFGLRKIWSNDMWLSIIDADI